MQGLVMKSTGTWIKVALPDGREVQSRIRGQLRLRGIDSTNPVAVGDKVALELNEDGTGTILDVLDRSNMIVRKSVKLSRQTQVIAANIDRAWLVATPAFPRTSTGFIDRFLAAAESFRIPAGIILNKSDLFTGELERFTAGLEELYTPLGYPCIRTSVIRGEGLSLLREALQGKVSLLSGHSGVGKSSLINALEPTLALRTGAISEQHLKGKHTTTFAEMHPLTGGGYIIDTPGIREFVNIDFSAQEIGHYFVEIRAVMGECRFNDCLHNNEGDCAVKAAVEAGKIAAERYTNYLSMLNNEDIYR